jgi:hypothetical protein
MSLKEPVGLGWIEVQEWENGTSFLQIDVPGCMNAAKARMAGAVHGEWRAI